MPAKAKQTQLEKTKANISAKIGDDVNVERPEWFQLMKEGVIVRLHIRRWRAQCQITFGDLGLPEPKDKKERLAYDGLMVFGNKFLLPIEYIHKYDATDSGARKWLDKNAYDTYWGKFVVVGVYADWKQGDEKFCATYIGYPVELDQEWDKIIALRNDRYASTAQRAYHNLARLNPKALSTGKGRISLDDFRDNFVQRIIDATPDKQQVIDSFAYETERSYIPLPSMLEEDMARKEKFEAQRERQRETERVAMKNLGDRERMMRQMNEDVVREARQRKSELANQFVRDLQTQSLGIIYDGFVNVLESMSKPGNNGALVGKAATQVRNVIESWRSMNLVGDQEIEGQIARMSGLMNKPAGERTPAEVQAMLREIAISARGNLVALGAPPRSGRSVGIPDKVQPLELHRAQRNAQLNVGPADQTKPMEFQRARRSTQLKFEEK